MRDFFKPLALLVLLNISTQNAVFADNGNISVKTGKGTEMVIRKGYFGGEEAYFRDSKGNGFERKKSGWLGSKESGLSLFGNQVKKKKGLFGGSQVEAKTILGDTVTSKKGLFGFGRRNTTIDASGVTGLVQQFIGQNQKLPPLIDPAASPGASSLGVDPYSFTPGAKPDVPPSMDTDDQRTF